jgi:23S rRNA pseudouridine2605 synthase
MRLNKTIAHAGYCSRRTADDLIKQGAVTVNGSVVDNCATQVGDTDLIAIHGQSIKQRTETRLWCFYKPVGFVTTHADPQGRPTVFSYLKKYIKDSAHIVSVGRLDINSEGLLLLTNNGDLAGYLMHPSAKLARIYRVRVYGAVSCQQLTTLTKPFTIDGIHYRPFEFLSPLTALPKGNHWITLRIYEGKYREIRKAMEHIGLQVSRLIRTHYGPFDLDEHKSGEVWETNVNLLKNSGVTRNSAVF